jgi:hypothetical protein
LSVQGPFPHAPGTQRCTIAVHCSTAAFTKRTARTRADDRKILERTLSVLCTGARWQDLPRRIRFPNPLLETAEGVGGVRRLGDPMAGDHLGSGNRTETGLGASLSRWGFHVRQKASAGVGSTRRGEGTELMLVTGGAGLRVGPHLNSAQKADVYLAETALETVKARTPAGQVRTRPRYLVADKGYTSRRFWHYLRRRGIGHTFRPSVARPASAHGDSRGMIRCALLSAGSSSAPTPGCGTTGESWLVTTDLSPPIEPLSCSSASSRWERS